MPYSDEVIDHFNKPRNVGSMGSLSEVKLMSDVGRGVVGAPECGDVMRLDLRIKKGYEYKTNKKNTYVGLAPFDIGQHCIFDENVGLEKILEIKEVEYIADAKFKAFGCGSAIASASLATELVKNKTIGEALKIKNTYLVEQLSLPPVKIHCSVLAEDAIKSAVKDYQEKVKVPDQDIQQSYPIIPPY